MQKNCWRIKCNHTPETIDRIMISFRKRGLMLDSLVYKKVTDALSECEIEFEEEEENAGKIYKNLSRIEDIISIEVLQTA